MGKKKKALAARAQGGIALKAARRANKEDRRARKVVIRKKQKHSIAADVWAAPAPSHLVAKLDVPKVKSKYQSYFEFAENTERKEKRLEFQITDNPKPPPGFGFVAIGDPVLTKACKELSREQGAMIFIVSASKEEKSKISEHMYRSGYHFRESIIETARQVIGETIATQQAIVPGQIEPIPETQEEITKQADAAIRDLFPRIPNTDRQMILEHAFKKGAQFHGEPTVGLQADLPLSRRVQLAVLAHIRHTHTRYDRLLRETTWVNARKVVEPVCLDVLVKWRGDEETGRDQMDEILREVVIITDSDDSDESSSEEDSSEDEGEVISISSAEAHSAPASRPQPYAAQKINSTGEFISDKSTSESMINPASVEASLHTRAKINTNARRERRAQRGFKRYQAAWDNALHRRQNARQSNTPNLNPLYEDTVNGEPRPIDNTSLLRDVSCHPLPVTHGVYRGMESGNRDQPRQDVHITTRLDPYYSQYRPTAEAQIQRNEVIVRPPPEWVMDQDSPRRSDSPSQPIREQRPPQVVRGSPQKYSLQDMLVPSIESSSSDAIRPLNERHNMYDDFNTPRDLYSRRVLELRRPSPTRRQVVVVDDANPPQNKRRRLAVEDSGGFRPVPSSDQSVYAPPPSDSYLLAPSSVKPKDFLIRRPVVESEYSQGLPWAARSPYGPPMAQIPIYDSPEPSNLARPSEQFRRADVFDTNRPEGPAIVRQVNSTSFHHNSESGNVYPRPTIDTVRDAQSVRAHEGNRGFRQAEPDFQSSRTQRLRSPNFTASSRVSRSYEDPSRPIIDQTFIHDFSQSQLDGPIYAAKSRRQLEGQGNRPHDYDHHSGRSFSTIAPTRVRSPAGYLHRPISRYEHGETGRSIVYEEDHSPTKMHYPPGEQIQPPILVREGIMRPSGNFAPARTRPPRHELVVFD